VKDGVKVIGRAKQESLAKVDVELKPTEYQIHKAFVQYVRKAHPKYAHLLIHIPNEGKRSHKGVSAQKALGFKTGCLDIFFAKPKFNTEWKEELNKNGFIRSSHKHGLWLEFKAPGKKITMEQMSFFSSVVAEGYEAFLVDSIDEAIQRFEEYLK